MRENLLYALKIKISGENWDIAKHQLCILDLIKELLWKMLKNIV